MYVILLDMVNIFPNMYHFAFLPAMPESVSWSIFPPTGYGVKALVKCRSSLNLHFSSFKWDWAFIICLLAIYTSFILKYLFIPFQFHISWLILFWDFCDLCFCRSVWCKLQIFFSCVICLLSLLLFVFHVNTFLKNVFEFISVFNGFLMLSNS